MTVSSFMIIIIPSSLSIGRILCLIECFSRKSSSPIIFALNLITSSIIITHHSGTLFQISHKKSTLRLIIPSMNTKSYWSLRVGIISRAFHKILSIVLFNHDFSKLLWASSYDCGEKSMVVICHQYFASSYAIPIVEKPLAVPISRTFCGRCIWMRSCKKCKFTSLMFGTLFFIQYSRNSFSKELIGI